MSQDILRDLERRWRESWDPEYGHRYVQELVRRGLIDTPEPEAMLEALAQGWPMLGEAETRSLAWGARSQLEILGVTQRIWQYSALNIIVVRFQGYPYLLRPQPAKATRFAGLCASPWPAVESWGEDVFWAWRHRVGRAAPWVQQAHRPPPPANQPLPSPLEHLLGLDFAPLLSRDITALAEASFPAEATRQTLALLDTLLRFRGSGTSEFEPASVHLDAASLPERYRARAPSGDLGVQRSATEGIRCLAFAQRVAPIDGQSGGYTDSLCGLELRVSHDGAWRFQRDVLWSYQNWGVPLT